MEREARIRLLREKVDALPIPDYLYFVGSVAQIKRRRRHEENTEDVLDTVFGGYGFGPYSIHPLQLRSEMEATIDYLSGKACKTVVEIGTGKAGSLYGWANGIETVETVVSIDKDKNNRRQEKEYLQRLVPDKELIYVRGNSHSRETREEVITKLSGREVDFLFIDGDHTYEGVKKDFEDYRSLVDEGGIIGFHDIICHTSRWETPEFWSKLKSLYSVKEIIDKTRDLEEVIMEDFKLDAHGIGLIEANELER